MPRLPLRLAGLALACLSAAAQEPAADRLQPMDVFDLEFASDPRIAPDGGRVVYVRNFFDVMTDRARSNLWIVGSDGTGHRPLTTGNANDSSPRWSPDGGRLAYLSDADGTSQVWVRWMDTGQVAKVTNLTESPSSLCWSPDGRWLAFSMRVPDPREPFVKMPAAPEGASWAPAPKVITEMIYRADGAGYLPDGHRQLFVVPAQGGTPRQLTAGPWDHDGRLAWTADGRSILFSANRREDADREPRDSEIHAVDLADGTVRTLTDRYGPDQGPVLSPDGRKVAFLGLDDQLQGYQVTRLYMMNLDGSERHCLTFDFDRSVSSPAWAADGRGLFFQYDDQGNTRIGFVELTGGVRELASYVGGTTLGRPYASGSFSVAPDGRYAYTRTRPDRPADVAVGKGAASPRVVTGLNEDLLGYKELGTVEELWCESSFDRRPIQAWVCRPPGFEEGRRYPLILEIHGGPFANYGNRFSAEVQLYAAAGYVVLYVNPRGSTGYGEEFGNLIHHAYPGRDYDDLMSAVDRLIGEGYVDPERLYVTGGSGGGVLTAWIVGRTERFKAAVVAKPVIHWTSFALTADAYNFFYRYWFPGPPWEYQEEYWKRSPLSQVGRVKTPTMLLTGEADYRTPISESEQFYQALRLAGVETAFVRIPEASHGIAARPSHLMAKVLHVLEWFARHP